MTSQPKEVFWTRLDPDTRRELDRLAAKNERSAAAEARLAIQQYVDKNKGD